VEDKSDYVVTSKPVFQAVDVSVRVGAVCTRCSRLVVVWRKLNEFTGKGAGEIIDAMLIALHKEHDAQGFCRGGRKDHEEKRQS
jgi:hypothetical protein